MSFLEKIKPSVSKRALLFVAGCAWTLAGGILIARGLTGILVKNSGVLLELMAGGIIGAVFYVFLFMKISGKHINRIQLIPVDNPCFFSFFNFRSYILMAVMITAGITLRKFRIVNPDYLFTFYLGMGIPLLLSARRFFISWYKSKTAK
ncbi:MAG: hypothetical protein ACM3N9_07620 [Syntrophothermus sp.]